MSPCNGNTSVIDQNSNSFIYITLFVKKVFQGYNTPGMSSETNKTAASGGEAKAVRLPPQIMHARLRHCSPARSHSRADTVLDTCLTREDVRIAVKRYNQYQQRLGVPEQVIELKEGVKGAEESALKELHRRLGTPIGKEYRWLALPFLNGRSAPISASPTSKKKKISKNSNQEEKENQEQEDGRSFEEAFRPVMPKSWLRNDREWLSNIDIDKVMRQYEVTIPEFAFVGVFPMDFSHRLESGKCVSTEMCNFRLADMLLRGKTRIGIVLNMDKHDESGSHWVCCFIGLDPFSKSYGMFYYDSVAVHPPVEVVQLMDDVKRQVDDLKRTRLLNTRKTFVCQHNRERRQYKGTECGVFVMFFVVCCACGTLDFEYICRSMGRDDDLHTLRQLFFTPPPTLK